MGEMIHHRILQERDSCEAASVGYLSDETGVREVSAHKASMLALIDKFSMLISRLSQLSYFSPPQL